ncbi:hypothetical protein [Labilithrix luteola]|nr:hypothetical protein [Labilithrix luteola]
MRRLGASALAALVSITACSSKPPETPVGQDKEPGEYPLPPPRTDVPGASAETPASADEGQPNAPPQGEATDEGTAETSNLPAPPWPRRVSAGGVNFAVYQPEVDSLSGDKLQARAAVEARTTPESPATYGIVWLDAKATTDRARGVVTLDDVQLTRASFPAAKDKEGQYLTALRGANLMQGKTLPLERVKSATSPGAKKGNANATAPTSQTVKNEAPTILVSQKPEMLVLVDGKPRLRSEDGVQRVINTRALILTEKGAYYLYVGDRWFRATAIDGVYTAASNVPASFDAVKKKLGDANAVDLFPDVADRTRQGMTIVVADKPTELIETRGAPTYEAIPGTTLQSVTNTDSDVFKDTATNTTYVLLSGRWFRASSLDGPWAYVVGKDMPATFKNIPKDHREARVLTSIPDTAQAQEAAIATQVPSMATIDRAETQLNVSYDGQPRFEPVKGAAGSLRYAVNTATPVLATGDGMYYACENGVWFVAASPEGPWTVATSVPDAVYTIPPSSPLYYVTYVRVYDYTPEYVYDGYTPGYYGAVYTDGVVVYGTGYYYPPWIGSVWYGWPCTWGFGVGFGFGFGFGVGFGIAFGGFHHPWWGPGRFWGHGPHWGWRGGPGFAFPNAYHHWSPVAVRPPAAPRAFAGAPGRFGNTPIAPAHVAPGVARTTPQGVGGIRPNTLAPRPGTAPGTLDHAPGRGIPTVQGRAPTMVNPPGRGPMTAPLTPRTSPEMAPFRGATPAVPMSPPAGGFRGPVAPPAGGFRGPVAPPPMGGGFRGPAAAPPMGGGFHGGGGGGGFHGGGGGGGFHGGGGGGGHR